MTTRSKRGSSAYRSYLASTKDDLRKAYSSYSSKKEEAWDYCKKLCKDFDGHGLKVIGANNYHFSAGFLYEANGKEFLMFITHGGDWPIEIVKEVNI